MNIGDVGTTQPLKDVREQNIVRRSKRLRIAGGVLTPESFAKRKAHFVAKVSGCPITSMRTRALPALRARQSLS